MAWTDPKTWVSFEETTSADFNTYIRDNLLALRSPPSARVDIDRTPDYTTTSLTFVDVHSTELALAITTSPGLGTREILVGFSGIAQHSSPSYINFELDLNGSPVAGNDGILRVKPLTAAQGQNFEFIRLISGLNASTLYTIKLQWKTGAGTATLPAGAGPAGNRLVHPHFWAREIS